MPNVAHDDPIEPVHKRAPRVSPDRTRSHQEDHTHPASDTTAVQKLTNTCKEYGRRLTRTGQEYRRKVTFTRKYYGRTDDGEYRRAHDCIDKMCREIVRKDGMWKKNFAEPRKMWKQLKEDFDLKVDPGDLGPPDSKYQRSWTKVVLTRLDYLDKHNFENLKMALMKDFLARAIVKVCLDKSTKNQNYEWAVEMVGTENHELQSMTVTHYGPDHDELKRMWEVQSLIKYPKS